VVAQCDAGRVHLSRRVSGLLLAFGGWSWIIWPTFLKNIAADDRSWHQGPTAFLLVHVVLTVLSLSFGTAIGALGWLGLRAARRSKAPSSMRPKVAS
jgi:hypothetical protein